jgi:hypothetical protein
MHSFKSAEWMLTQRAMLNCSSQITTRLRLLLLDIILEVHPLLPPNHLSYWILLFGPASPEIREVIASSKCQGSTGQYLMRFDGAVVTETWSGGAFVALPRLVVASTIYFAACEGDHPIGAPPSAGF